MKDDISKEIDRRKLEKLQDDGLDLANAPIYIICPFCDSKDLAYGDDCPSCGENYDSAQSNNVIGDK